MDIVYTLAAIYNFININNLDDLLDDNLEVKNKVIDEDDTKLTKAEGNVVINQRCNEIAKLMWKNYCQAISRPIT